jgi:hypothetical protein
MVDTLPVEGLTSRLIGSTIRSLALRVTFIVALTLSLIYIGFLVYMYYTIGEYYKRADYKAYNLVLENQGNFLLILVLSFMIGLLFEIGQYTIKFLTGVEKKSNKDFVELLMVEKIPNLESKISLFEKTLTKNFTEIEKEIKGVIKGNTTIDGIQKAIYEKVLNDLQKEVVESSKKEVYEKVLQNLDIYLIEKVEENYRKLINFELFIDSINPITSDTQKSIDKLQRNSALNLYLGIIVTSISVFILISTILFSPRETDISIALINLLPRISFVIFIQIFAFFFLRLYRNNLEDIKYYQNELTNLNTKVSALKVAHIFKNEKRVDSILKELSLVERNYKLAKEESTAYLKKAELENEMDTGMLNMLTDLLKYYQKTEEKKEGKKEEKKEENKEDKKA